VGVFYLINVRSLANGRSQRLKLPRRAEVKMIEAMETRLAMMGAAICVQEFQWKDEQSRRQRLCWPRVLLSFTPSDSDPSHDPDGIARGARHKLGVPPEMGWDALRGGLESLSLSVVVPGQIDEFVEDLDFCLGDEKSTQVGTYPPPFRGEGSSGFRCDVELMLAGTPHPNI
jgi:hypothetical protein